VYQKYLDEEEKTPKEKKCIKMFFMNKTVGSIM
jgi:hypothetical protein